MTEKTLFIVQQFEQEGETAVAGNRFTFPTAAAAAARADRDENRCFGVVALQQRVNVQTGEVLANPVILARHGELPDHLPGLA